MAQQPKPQPKPDPKPAPKPNPEPDEGEADKPPAAAAPVRTIADEQRERSDEIAREGVEKWKAAHDERTAEEKGAKQVPGVAAPAPEGGSWAGSTRSTQAGRSYQNPAAPR